MSEREWKLFLHDAEKSINRIIEYTEGMGKERFFQDYKTFDAVMRNLTIIGEAIKHIPQDIRGKYKEIEWKKISGLRDIIVHGYFGIDEDIIWDVVENKIHELKAQIEALIKKVL